MAEPTGPALDRTIRYVDDTRYLALVGLTILVYDAILTLPNELYFVWLSPNRKTSTATRIAYAMNRYGTIVMSALFLTVLFPGASDDTTWVYTKEIIMSFAGLILRSLLRVWGCTGRLAWMMGIGYALTHSVIVAFAGLAIKQVDDNIAFANLLGFIACALPKTPNSFLGAFIPAAVLDCYAFGLLLGNALSRPRSASQHLLDMLLRDGLVYFLICFLTKTINIAVTAGAPTALVFVSWGFGFDLGAVATARLYLRMCESDFLPNNASEVYETDNRSSYASFIDSIVDEGELVSRKVWQER
ncbi:hypothetical protein SCHPADRAFT_940612 [Schizopora paradoxa]|uniref:DUF6533 domain-containing protein n=1 Tax=Schizopora paradoxa TaxID=27342 RepID=A0A0H2S8E0_9AGAM|nr:hypothetical protein SCHPADRAFT_940612 [Schizopora paradoxa]